MFLAGAAEELGHCVAGDSQRQTARHHRVDADHPPPSVGERTAGVAGREPHVGLYPVLPAGPVPRPGRPGRMDDPGRERANHAQRIADREHEITDAQSIGVSRVRRRQVLSVDRERGQVAIRVPGRNHGFERAPVREPDARARTLGDVGVGDNRTAARPDHARPGAASTPSHQHG